MENSTEKLMCVYEGRHFTFDGLFTFLEFLRRQYIVYNMDVTYDISFIDEDSIRLRVYLI